MYRLLILLSCFVILTAHLDLTPPPPPPHPHDSNLMSTSKILLGAGCFWCVEAAFNRLKGVRSAISGYSNGHTVNPTYSQVCVFCHFFIFLIFLTHHANIDSCRFRIQVCSGNTGHAEVVQVEYDKSVLDTQTLLKVFFFVHDPTQLNRQGNDIGTQYRSGVFYTEPEQKSLAEQLIAELNASGNFKSPIVTEVTPAAQFYPAEAYHQQYFVNNPNQGYCAAVVRPKYDKFIKTYKALLKD